jgi:hypothetical protein
MTRRRPTINGQQELRAFLMGALGDEPLREYLDVPPGHTLDNHVGPMVALAREWFHAVVSEDLREIARKHRADYMRQYMRRLRDDPDVAARAAAEQRVRREKIRRILSEKAREYYARNKREIAHRRQERQRQDALGELIQITGLKDDGND